MLVVRCAQRRQTDERHDQPAGTFRGEENIITTQKLSRTRVLAPGLLLAMTRAASLVWLEARQAPAGGRCVGAWWDDNRGRGAGGKGPRWCLGDCGDHSAADEVREGGGDGRAGAVRSAGPAEGLNLGWVLGYGWVDSQPWRRGPGKVVTLRATKTTEEAAKIYPSDEIR